MLSAIEPKAKSELQQAYAKLDARWEQENERFRKFGLARMAWTPTPSPYPEGNEPDGYGLAWHKHGGNWQICELVVTDAADDEFSVTPVTSLPVEERIRFLKFIPQLEDAVVKSSAELSTDIQKALATSR